MNTAKPAIRELQEELYCVKDKCQDIGIQLGLDDDALRQIEESYPDSSNQLRHVLRLWLGRGDASWSKLVTVLRHPVIDEKEVADKLESKYCPVLKASPAPSQECIVLEDPPTPDNAPSSSTTANDEESQTILRCAHCKDSGEMQANCLSAHLKVCPADAVVPSSTCTTSERSSKARPTLSPVVVITRLPVRGVPCSSLVVSIDRNCVNLKEQVGRKRSLTSETNDSTHDSPQKELKLDECSEEANGHLTIPDFPSSSSGYNELDSEDLKKRVFELLDQLKQAVITLSELNSRLVSLENQVSVQCTPPQFFLVREVSKHVTAMSGWISPSFYSHQFGCKLHLVLWLSSSQSILNLEIVHDEGVNDDMLKWPCKGKVIIKIVNQVNDSNHCRKGLKFTLSKTAGSISSHAFSLLRKEPSVSYIENDVLFLKVKFVSIELPIPWSIL